MTQSNIDSVSDRLRSLEREVSRMQSDLAQSIQNLVRVTEQGTRQIVAEVEKSTTMAGQTEIARQEAQLIAGGPILEQQREALEQELQRASDGMDRVISKYDDMHEELLASYTRDIRRLGEKIYDLVDVDYDRSIQGNYDDRRPRGLFGRLMKFVDEARSTNLQKAFENARHWVGAFLDKRDSFFGQIDDRLTNIAVNEPTTVAIPFWLATVQSPDGKKTDMVVAPSGINPSGEGIGYTFRSLGGDFDIVKNEMTRQISSTGLRDVAWNRLASQEVGSIVQSLQRMTNQYLALPGSLVKTISTQLTEFPPDALDTGAE